jgi:hypothetical protein
MRTDIFPYQRELKMNLIRFAIPFLIAMSLVSCVTSPATTAPATPVDTVVVPLIPPDKPVMTPTNTGDEVEQAQVRELVETFGKRLQNVSLLSPDAGQELHQQYSEYVSPALLETWRSDIAAAPGRMVSSPWPDRIEIAALEKINVDQYVVTGSIIEVTSAEISSGEAANRIPIQIEVEKTQGRWLITEFTQKG